MGGAPGRANEGLTSGSVARASSAVHGRADTLRVTASATTAIALALLATSPPADTGRTVTGGPLHPRLEVVEQGVADRGGIETSTRVLPVDLRLPTGFGAVYRSPEGDGRLMRGNGALFAVFPRSLYRRTVIGAVPVTPAGVVYSIGMPGGHDFPGGSLAREDDPQALPSASKVDLRVRPKPATAVASSSEAPRGTRTLDPMPPISEVVRASPAGAAASAPGPVTDLRLGPPVLVRD
jgi:hypothetical protein